MPIVNFLSKRVVLPIGILLQIVGYAESVHKLVGLPGPFFVASVGFALTIVCLIWLVWFSGSNATAPVKRIALGALVLLSVGYFVLVQYQVLVLMERNTINITIEVDGARSLLASDANEALQRVDRVIKHMPDIPEAYNIRGVALYRLHRYAEALPEFETAAKLDPVNSQYEYNQAIALRSMCDYARAKALLDSYIVNHKTDMWGRYLHGVVSQVLGYDDVALADYTIVIQSMVDPTEGALFNSAVIYAKRAAKAAKVDEQNRTLTDALSFLDRAIKINRTARIQKIQEALVPIEKREFLCNGLAYATDDLTPVSQLPQFKSWIQQLSQ